MKHQAAALINVVVKHSESPLLGLAEVVRADHVCCVILQVYNNGLPARHVGKRKLRHHHHPDHRLVLLGKLLWRLHRIARERKNLLHAGNVRARHGIKPLDREAPLVQPVVALDLNQLALQFHILPHPAQDAFGAVRLDHLARIKVRIGLRSDDVGVLGFPRLVTRDLVYVAVFRNITRGRMLQRQPAQLGLRRVLDVNYVERMRLLVGRHPLDCGHLYPPGFSSNLNLF
ncbi:hypothetical protein ES703_45388 [subsurface metagenome]